VDRRRVRGGRRGWRAAIARGDVYQVNSYSHLFGVVCGRPCGNRRRARPFGSASEPPRGATVGGRRGPGALPRAARRAAADDAIKGTRPAGEESTTDKTRRARVIVDLERNDLSRVCEVGSISAGADGAARARGVTISCRRFEGRLRPGVGLAEIPPAVFPGGSVTGAPKIQRRRPHRAARGGRRGASMGALGTCARTATSSLALTIRTSPSQTAASTSGRRRHRLGLRSGGGDRGVVGQGAALLRGGRGRVAA